MKYLKTMLGLIFLRGFQLWNLCGRQDKGFGKFGRRTSIIDKSTALPSALDGSKGAGLSYFTPITLSQKFSDISVRSSWRSWKEARKAGCEFSEVPTSLQRPAGRSLQTLQKDHYVFGFSPNAGIRRAPHTVVLAVFPDCYTLADGHRFVGWRGEIMKGKGFL